MFRERDVPAECGMVNVYNSSGKTYWFPRTGRYPPGTPTQGFLADLHNGPVDVLPTNFPLPAYIGKEHISTQGRTRAEKLKLLLGFPDEQDVVMKDCYHRKISAVNLPFTFYWQDPSSEYYGYWWSFVRCRLRFFYSNWITDSHLVLPTVDTAPCSWRAWYHLQPRFESEIGMLNFVYELKDFRDIARYALKNLGSSQLANLLRTLRKSFPEIASQPTKTAAELNLINQFAIKPLISDLCSIGQALMVLVSDAQQLYAESGSKFQKKHYSEVLNQPAPLTPGENNTTYYNWMEYGNQTKDVFTATLRYQYKYNVRDHLAAFTQYWGLRPTAEVIWNMIPFSFLVDYTIKIGQSLHALELDPNTILTKYQYCESVKRSLMAGCVGREDPKGKTHHFFLDEEYIGDSAGLAGRPVSGYFGKVYHRYVTKPQHGLYVPRTSWPSGQQAINMAALLRCFL